MEDFTRDDIETILNEIDYDKTGLLTYSQFLLATLEPKLFADDMILENYFRDLDSLKEGFLTIDSILITLKRKGFELRRDQIEQAFDEI